MNIIGHGQFQFTVYIFAGSMCTLSVSVEFSNEIFQSLTAPFFIGHLKDGHICGTRTIYNVREKYMNILKSEIIRFEKRILFFDDII